MANCHSLIQVYHNEITIPKAKKDKLNGSKQSLRKRIRSYFKEHHPEYEPKFFVQGSANPRMNTGIRTKDDICDLDDGIYFMRTPDVTATTMQNWIWDAVEGYTETDPEHRRKCIRNIFTKDYEIDHPVYYHVKGSNYHLAVKNTGWEQSDPKAFIDWFHDQKDKFGQLVRIVKYLKGWCDNIRDKMPSGLAMTILACLAKDNITYNSDRDDITLRDILKEIKKSLEEDFKCTVPAVPFDDLFEDYDKSRKENFMTALQNFLDDAEAALAEDNHLKASKRWKKHFGDRFPIGEDVSDAELNQSRLAKLRATASLMSSGHAYSHRTGDVNATPNGIKHQPHRFHYGK